MKLLTLSLVSFALKVSFTKFGFYHIDLITFQLWSLDLIRYGFSNFYQIEHSIYPPGFLYVLWAVGKIYYWLIGHNVLISAELMFKLPSIAADSLNGILIYLIGRRFTTEKGALIAAGVALFNPAFFINSTYWGQIDGFVSFFLLASFYLLIRGNLWFSAIMIGVCQVIKPYAVISLPIFLLYLHLKKVSPRRLIAYFLIFTFTVIALFIPFNTGNIFWFIAERYSAGLEEWPAATSNAFNFWAAISIMGYGFMEKVTDTVVFLGLSYRIWGTLIFGGVYLGLLIFFVKNFKRVSDSLVLLVSLVALSYWAMFLFLTRMHERHFYFALVFLTLLLPLLKLRSRAVIVLTYAGYTLNLYYAYRLTTEPIFYLSPQVIAVLSIMNVLIFFYLLKTVIYGVRLR